MNLVLVGALVPATLMALREALVRHTPDFDAETWRQDTPGTAHSHTQTLYLRMPPTITRETVFESLEVEDRMLMGVPMFCRAVATVAKIARGKPARAMIVRLHPERAVARHIDQGGYAAATQRYHLAINTNPGAQLIVDDTAVTPKPGEIYFFDKSQPHLAANWGRTPRDHLIVDIWK